MPSLQQVLDTGPSSPAECSPCSTPNALYNNLPENADCNTLPTQNVEVIPSRQPQYFAEPSSAQPAHATPVDNPTSYQTWFLPPPPKLNLYSLSLKRTVQVNEPEAQPLFFAEPMAGGVNPYTPVPLKPTWKPAAISGCGGPAPFPVNQNAYRAPNRIGDIMLPYQNLKGTGMPVSEAMSNAYTVAPIPVVPRSSTSVLPPLQPGIGSIPAGYHEGPDGFVYPDQNDGLGLTPANPAVQNGLIL